MGKLWQSGIANINAHPTSMFIRRSSQREEDTTGFPVGIDAGAVFYIDTGTGGLTAETAVNIFTGGSTTTGSVKDFDAYLANYYNDTANSGEFGTVAGSATSGSYAAGQVGYCEKGSITWTITENDVLEVAEGASITQNYKLEFSAKVINVAGGLVTNSSQLSVREFIAMFQKQECDILLYDHRGFKAGYAVNAVDVSTGAVAMNTIFARDVIEFRNVPLSIEVDNTDNEAFSFTIKGTSYASSVLDLFLNTKVVAIDSGV